MLDMTITANYHLWRRFHYRSSERLAGYLTFAVSTCSQLRATAKVERSANATTCGEMPGTHLIAN